jgi:hypothetical protein
MKNLGRVYYLSICTYHHNREAFHAGVVRQNFIGKNYSTVDTKASLKGNF